MKIDVSGLQTNGFVSVAYPEDLRNRVENACDSWKRFCALPSEVKSSIPYSNSADGIGYELKTGTGFKADRKENFDITLGGRRWIEEHCQTESKVVLEFFRDATNCVEVMKPIVTGFASSIEDFYGLRGLCDAVKDSENSFFVRFLHYFGNRQPGDETATAHTDQSGFTLHLFESDPGLQCLNYDGNWNDMPVSAGETVIISSMQMQLLSHGGLRALCHRVIATPETVDHGRYSAVCFVQLQNVPKYNKGLCGRLQEKTPGFNYVMSHLDFSKLFA